MNFCVATVEYFTSIGFDTEGWRTSTDGLQAIAHDRFIKVLLPSYKSDANIQTFVCPSDELDNLLNSAEWTIPEIV